MAQFSHPPSTPASTPEPALRFQRLSLILAGALAAAASLAVLAVTGYCVLARIAYPFELESMEGGFADHARRLAAGGTLYAPPAADFIPFLYTPLHHVVSSWLVRAGLDALTSGRVVSLASIAAATILATALAARASRHRWWALFTPVLVASAYFRVDGYFDVARPDNLMTLLVLIAAAALTLRNGVIATLVFAAATVSAFFAKQSAAVALLVLVPAAMLMRWRVGVPGAVLAALTIAALHAWLQSTTGGWYQRYIVDIAGFHYRSLGGLARAVFTDLFGHFAVQTLIVCLLLIAGLSQRGGAPVGAEKRRTSFRVLLGLWAAAAAFMIASRINGGGAANVVIPYALAVSACVPAALSWLLDRAPGPVTRAVALRAALVALAIAIGGGVETPRLYRPRAADRQTWESFREALRPYQQPGSVWVMDHGAALGAAGDAPLTPHVTAIQDLIGETYGPRTGMELPRDLLSQISQRRFSAIVVADGNLEMQELIREHYEPDERGGAFLLPVFSGYRERTLERIWVPRPGERR